jgi:thioredoxin-dependent peroxiredoxin
MAEIYCKGEKFFTCGNIPPIGSQAPDFFATKTDLSTCSLDDFKEQAVLFDVYPSIETSVCFESVKKFQEIAVAYPHISIVCISMDLPFALSRVEKGEQLNGITLLSDFRNREFGDVYGLTIGNGPLAGLLARAVILLDPRHQVIYQELVDDISTCPNYNLLLDILK